jgi:hypothetical protein
MDANNLPKPLTDADIKRKELERKVQIASEVNSSKSDIRTICRRIDNLKKKVLIQDIEKSIKQLKEQEVYDYDPDESKLTLDIVYDFFCKMEAKIDLRVSNL